MTNKAVYQMRMDILNSLSRTCYDIIQGAINKFKDTPGLTDVSEANINFAALFYDASSELLYAEEISSCRNRDGYIEKIIGTVYIFKKQSDLISMPDQFIDRVAVVPDINRIFEQRPKFTEIFSTSDSLLFYPEDLKELGPARINKPVFN